MLAFELLGYFSKRKESVYTKLSTSPPCRDTWLSSVNNRMIFFSVGICWFLRYFTKRRHFEKRFQEIENIFVMEKIVSLASEYLQTSKDLIRKDFAKCFGERGKAKGEYI